MDLNVLLHFFLNEETLLWDVMDSKNTAISRSN